MHSSDGELMLSFSFFVVCDVLSIRSQNRLVLIEKFCVKEKEKSGFFLAFKNASFK